MPEVGLCQGIYNSGRKRLLAEWIDIIIPTKGLCPVSSLPFVFLG